LLQDLDSGASVDRYLADQLAMYAALADGASHYSVPTLTEHLETNVWLVEAILGADVRVSEHSFGIQGIGFSVPR
jgi:RNA 3'-terminal phosphate cyclase (ATP)